MNQARPEAREKWQKIIESQRVSGQTAAAWCREHDVAYASFFAWKRRLQSAAPAVEFVEILAGAESRPADTDPACGTTGAIQVCCRGGRTLVLRRGFDRSIQRGQESLLNGFDKQLFFAGMARVPWGNEMVSGARPPLARISDLPSGEIAIVRTASGESSNLRPSPDSTATEPTLTGSLRPARDANLPRWR